MANRDLLETRVSRRAEPAHFRNEAGGPAHAFTPWQALAQHAATGCLSGTIYATVAELACQDLQPYGTTQAPTHFDVLSVGGISGRVFDSRRLHRGRSSAGRARRATSSPPRSTTIGRCLGA